MKRSGWALALVAMLAFLLRMAGASSRPIWYDDAFSLLLARQSLTDIVRGTAADTMPPLYYFLLHAWLLVADSIAGVRLLNVILGVAIVLVVFAVANRLFGRDVGLAAALLTAVSPIQIYQSQEIRMYIVLCLSLIAFVWAIVRAWRETEPRTWWPWMVAVAAGTAATYSHNLAVFSLVAPSVYFVLARQWKFLVKLLAAQAAIVVLSVPWLLYLPGQIAKIQAAFWTPRPGALELLQAILLFHGTLPLPGAAQAGLLLLSTMAVALTLLNALRSIRSEQVTFLLTLAIVPPAGLLIASYVMRPLFVPRAVMLSGLAYLILAAYAIARSPALPIRIALAACVLGAAALSLPFQHAFRSFPRSPFPEASAHLEGRVLPGDLVVHDNKLSYFPMFVYVPGLDQRFLADEAGDPNDTLAPATQAALGLFPVATIEEATIDKSRVFFVVFKRAIDEYRALGLQDHPNLTWLRDHYSASAVTAFGDLLVYEFSD